MKKATESGSRANTSSSTSTTISPIIPARRLSGVNFWNQVIILLWKSVVSQRYWFFMTAVQILAPILLVEHLINPIPNQPHNETISNKSNSSLPLLHTPVQFMNPRHTIHFEEDFEETEIVYAPRNASLDHLFSMFTRVNITTVGDYPSIVKIIKNDKRKIIGLYVWEYSAVNGQIKYELIKRPEFRETIPRMTKRLMEKRSQRPVMPFEPYYKISTILTYVNTRHVQHFCELKFGNSSTCEQLHRKVELYQLPYPAYYEPVKSLLPTAEIYGMLITTSYIFVGPTIVNRITHEKNTKARELLRLAGLSDFVYWLSHFIYSLVIVCFHAIGFCYFFFKYNPSYQNTSITLFAFVFLLFGCQTILFSMLITTVFNRPFIAQIIVTVFWLMSSEMLAVIIFKEFRPPENPEASTFVELLLCLLPTGSFLVFSSIIGQFENEAVGLTWSRLVTSYNGNVTTFVLIAMYFFSFILYIFLIWYIDNVWPLQYGVAKSPFFFFFPTYWDPPQEEAQSQTTNQSTPTATDADFFEPEPDNLRATIQLKGVTKKFRRKVAVDNVWLNVYENQLTVLLGHNGAGKSTTMNMITGMFKPTSGTVWVDSYNVATHTKEARGSLGLCPQESNFFDELTVYEHLKLFAVLKNQDSPSVEEEIERILNLVKLNNKKSYLAVNLSGGLKRRLWLGMALIAHTNILVLDEPTTGLDPETRRVIWDLLISLRRKRTILLTTHYMEEADVLADRILIMSNGKIICSGSPLFLKNWFGTGYQLRVASRPGYNSAKFLKLIRKHIPSASQRSKVETESIFVLNQKTTDKKFLKKLEPLFRDIENKKDSLCLDSVGLSYSSLEDVFLRVGPDNLDPNKLHEKKDPSIPKIRSNSKTNSKSRRIHLTPQSDLISGRLLILNQIYALFLKRFHFARRSKMTLILQLIFPSVIFALSLINLEQNPKEVSVDLNLKDLYGADIKTFYHGPNSFRRPFRELNQKKYGASVVSYKSTSLRMNEWILDSVSNLVDYITKHVYGLQITNDSFIPWFNAEQTHSIPLSVTILYETLLRYIDHSTNPYIETRIRLIDSQETAIMAIEQVLQKILVLTFTWLNKCLVILPLSLPFIAASYIVEPLQEKCSKMKLLQLMTGLSPTIYWMVNFVFDLISHLFAIVIFFAIVNMCGVEQTFLGVNSESTDFLFMILFAFGFASIPFAYIMSNLFSSPSVGYSSLLAILEIFGCITHIFMSILFIFNVIVDRGVFNAGSRILIWPFRLIPIFSFMFGFQKFYLLTTMEEFCRTLDDDFLGFICQPNLNGTISLPCETLDKPSMRVVCESSMNSKMQLLALKGCCSNICGDKCYMKDSPYSFKPLGSGIELLFLFLTGIAYFIITLFIDRIKRFKEANKPELTLATPQNEDEDVLEERNRINQQVSTGQFTDLLCVHELTKAFGNQVAVNQISFSVHQDECFGLLGVNSAGKTTTFAMLTGDVLPSSGNAFILNGKYSLLNNLSHFRYNIGYCPQFNGVLPRLSARETLNIFGLLRGVPRSELKKNVDSLISLVGLRKSADNPIENYSGGNKRKLSIAISMISTPAVLFLDEPTAGVDPVARRKIWDLLALFKNTFQVSIVLTSHLMDECEALCSRIAIMVKGTFRCLGPTQHLRSKFGQGYSVLIRLHRGESRSEDYIKNLEQAIVQRMPSASLKDFHQNVLHYHVTDSNEKWSNIFKNLTVLDEKFGFEDYVVSDSTLESIFIAFARSQIDIDNDIDLTLAE